MARLILHIGGHRTGSTSIQAALHASAAKLRARGILYPRTGLSNVAHHALAYAVRSPAAPGLQESESFEKMLGELSREVAASRCQTVVLSSEEFFLAGELSLDRLSALLSLFSTVRVVCFLRHQAALLESSYKFEVLWEAAASAITFPEYVQRNTLGDHLEYRNIEPVYRSARSDLEIRFVSFSGAHRSGSLVRTFHQVAGLPECYGREIHTNESLGRAATLAVLMRNRSELSDSGVRRNFVRFADIIFPERQQSLFDQDLLGCIEQRFSAPNSALAAQLGFNLNDETAAFLARNALLGPRLLAREQELLLSRLARRNRFPRLCLTHELLSRVQGAAQRRLNSLFR